jgi:hypothetical protein
MTHTLTLHLMSWKAPGNLHHPFTRATPEPYSLRNELRYAFPDVHVGKGIAEVLLNSLFPKKFSRVYAGRFVS